MVDEVTAAFGGIDVLVNNAGIAIHRPALESPTRNGSRFST